MKKIFERFPETHPSHIPLKLGYECGLRIGEAYALTWEDIDLENKTLTVNRQVQWHEDAERSTADKKKSNGKADCGQGYWYFSNPKYNSFRTIDLSDDLCELLKREKARQKKMQEYYGEYYIKYYSNRPLEFRGKDNSGECPPNPITKEGGYTVNFLCVRESGEYISSRTMQHTSRVIKGLIPESFKFHDLRHTHVSILYENHVYEKYIKERMGHKKVTTTREYQEQSEFLNQHGRKALNDIFSGIE